MFPCWFILALLWVRVVGGWTAAIPRSLGYVPLLVVEVPWVSTDVARLFLVRETRRWATVIPGLVVVSRVV